MMDDKQINIDNFDQATGNGNPDAAEPGERGESTEADTQRVAEGQEATVDFSGANPDSIGERTDETRQEARPADAAHTEGRMVAPSEENRTERTIQDASVEPGDEREVISDDADARLNERTTGTVERGTDETQGRTVTGEFGDDPETKRATSNEGVDAAAERAAAGEETR